MCAGIGWWAANGVSGASGQSNQLAGRPDPSLLQLLTSGHRLQEDGPSEQTPWESCLIPVTFVINPVDKPQRGSVINSFKHHWPYPSHPSVLDLSKPFRDYQCQYLPFSGVKFVHQPPSTHPAMDTYILPISQVKKLWLRETKQSVKLYHVEQASPSLSSILHPAWHQGCQATPHSPQGTCQEYQVHSPSPAGTQRDLKLMAQIPSPSNPTWGVRELTGC